MTLPQVARAPLTLKGSTELSASHGPEHIGRNAWSDLGESSWLEWTVSTTASCSHVYAVWSLVHTGRQLLTCLMLSSSLPPLAAHS